MSGNAGTVVIVGGAIMGSCTAYFLKQQGFGGRILVVERDPSYQKSSTALSAAAIRTQFGCDINTRITLFAANLFRNIKDWFGAQATIGFVEKGYLILRRSLNVLDSVAAQNDSGADISVLYPDELKDRFPWINTDDIACGTFGNRNEGWFDAWALLSLMRAGAKDLGVEYMKAEATGITVNAGKASGVALADGGSLGADWVVNAGGALSANLTRELGVLLPVVPKKRTVFSIRTPQANDNFPMLVDPSGTWIRPEGEGFICGIAPGPDRDADAYDDFEPDYYLFEDKVWLNLAHRVPAMESLRMASAWAGHYEINSFDHNGIVGPHDEIDNLLFATGFSGHGVMQAPAIGRGLAEWIRTGRYQSLDLSPLGYHRIGENKPIIESTGF